MIVFACSLLVIMTPTYTEILVYIRIYGSLLLLTAFMTCMSMPLEILPTFLLHVLYSFEICVHIA